MAVAVAFALSASGCPDDPVELGEPVALDDPVAVALGLAVDVSSRTPSLLVTVNVTLPVVFASVTVLMSTMKRPAMTANWLRGAASVAMRVVAAANASVPALFNVAVRVTGATFADALDEELAEALAELDAEPCPPTPPPTPAEELGAAEPAEPPTPAELDDDGEDVADDDAAALAGAPAFNDVTSAPVTMAGPSVYTVVLSLVHNVTSTLSSAVSTPSTHVVSVAGVDDRTGRTLTTVGLYVTAGVDVDGEFDGVDDEPVEHPATARPAVRAAAVMAV